MRGRKRIGMLNELLDGGTYAKMKKRARDRRGWRESAKNLPLMGRFLERRKEERRKEGTRGHEKERKGYQI